MGLRGCRAQPPAWIMAFLHLQLRGSQSCTPWCVKGPWACRHPQKKQPNKKILHSHAADFPHFYVN